ncbi:putative glycosyl hydrolase 17 family protein [Lyophyllum shimeji]|uniref:glucan endo-1,3-beta-D-glucosidase n=1 Tax=Lyophyllum shimeji TaxID=47721 RepID=A0A9P3UID0_LYOSH|nr:putative glycosyl hydrolase 17 family protein [Lyophyllum shimeji]
MLSHTHPSAPRFKFLSWIFLLYFFSPRLLVRHHGGSLSRTLLTGKEGEKTTAVEIHRHWTRHSYPRSDCSRGSRWLHLVKQEEEVLGKHVSYGRRLQERSEIAPILLWHIIYPDGSLLPNCGNSLENVIRDIQLLSQLTKRLRLYGADCNQTALVLEAIKRTNVDMEVFLGNYVLPDDITAYERQRDVIKDAIQTYGTDHIAGITVGNEFMLNYLTKNQVKDPDSAVADEGAPILIANIKDTRDMLATMSLPKNIPVGNSDAGSYFNKQVLGAIDYGMANVHAWFANTTAEGASDWVLKFFDSTNVQPASQLPNHPKMYIAETGWPTKSSDAGNANNGGSDASITSLQTFLDTFICTANARGVPYFYFECFDEKWKDLKYGGVEGWWGLFDADRTLKDIKIPNCGAL